MKFGDQELEEGEVSFVHVQSVLHYVDIEHKGR